MGCSSTALLTALFLFQGPSCGFSPVLAQLLSIKFCDNKSVYYLLNFRKCFDSHRLHQMIGMRTPVRSHQCLMVSSVSWSPLTITTQRPEGRRTKRPMPRYAHGSRKYMARLSPTWTSAAPSSNVGLPQSPIKGGKHPASMPIRTADLRKRHLWYRRCDILASYDSKTRHRFYSVPGLFCFISRCLRDPLQPIRRP